MENIEFKAADVLLDSGVKVPLITLNLFSKRKRTIIMRRPMLGTLVRIAKIYLELGVTYKELSEYSFDENMMFTIKHSKKISRMVALTIVRGQITGWLFCGVVAWWLRWRVHPAMLQEAWFQMISMLNTKSFQSIIKSAEGINPLKRGNDDDLSRERKRS